MMKKYRFTWVWILLFVSVTCANKENQNFIKQKQGKPTWLYQLQNVKIEPLTKSDFTMVVMDYSRDGSDIGKFSITDIQSLLQKNLTPLAYLSIGEAETYRFYWKKEWLQQEGDNQATSLPSWMGRPNPDWVGNYKVRYWDPDWRDSYLKPYLDRILQQGFQGVYLDIIDAFEYWADENSYQKNLEIQRDQDPINDEEESARRMMDLVKWIARYCRQHSPAGQEFLIFPQNGERILLYDEDGSYLETVSGIGVETIWYQKNQKIPTPAINEKLRFLKKFRDMNKRVLSVDYIDNGNHKDRMNLKRIKDYHSKCRSKGFWCYAARTDSELNNINQILGIQP